MSIRALQVASGTARSGLQMYWRGALLGLLAAVVALSVAAPLVALAGGLDLGPVMRGLDGTWSPEATPIVVFQRIALRALLAPLLGVAGGVLGLAGVAILVGAAARAGQRSGEVAVRRAVGASQRMLALMALLEAGLIGGATLLASGGFGVAAFQLAATEWGGSATMGSTTGIIGVVAAFMGVFLVGSLFIMVPARSRGVRVASGPPLELYLAAAMLSVGLIVVTGSALLTKHVAANDSVGTSATRGALYQLEASVSASEYTHLLAALGALPSVQSVSISSPGVSAGLGEVGGITTDCGDCSENNMRLPFRLTTAVRHLASADTFAAIGARVIAGRGISANDVAGSLHVAVVNRALAARHFQNGEPVGRRIQIDGLPGWYTVVGVVDEPPAIGFGASFLPRFSVYLSVMQHPTTHVELLVTHRGAADPEVAGLIRTLLPNATVRSAITLAALRTEQLAPLRWVARWLAIEGWAGWIVAALGTLMLVRLWISALLPELGIRRAVGATRGSVLRTILGRAAGAGVGGVVCALWFGPGAWQALTRVVPGLAGWNSLLTMQYGGVLVGIAVLAALPGAWRAVQTGPAKLVEVNDG